MINSAVHMIHNNVSGRFSASAFIVDENSKNNTAFENGVSCKITEIMFSYR